MLFSALLFQPNWDIFCEMVFLKHKTPNTKASIVTKSAITAMIYKSSILQPYPKQHPIASKKSQKTTKNNQKLPILNQPRFPHRRLHKIREQRMRGKRFAL